MNRANILIVDDIAKNIQLAASVLKKEGWHLFFATSGAEALKVVEQERIDLILMDVMMPGMDGFETTKRIKRHSALESIPVIFLTAKNDRDSIQKGFELGGVDYIIKPFHDVELIARVRTHLSIREMSQELKAAAQKLYELAHTDSLTGIANRLKFNTIAEHQIEMIHRYGGDLSVIFFDIDHFKKVNDEMGHEFGDHVLKSISNRIQTEIRKSDLLARWGGEEFVIVMPQAEKKQATRLAEKLRKTIEAISLESQHFTCSFGVVALQENETFDALMRRADEALYEAKAQGRNCVVSA